MNSQNLDYLNKSDANLFNDNELMSTIKNDSDMSIGQTDIEDVKNLNSDSDNDNYIPNEDKIKDKDKDGDKHLQNEADESEIIKILIDNEINEENNEENNEKEEEYNNDSDGINDDLSMKKVRFTDGEESNLSKIDEQTEESVDD